MNALDIYTALGELNPEIYREAENYAPKQKKRISPIYMRISLAAAVVLIIFVSVFAVLKFRNTEEVPASSESHSASSNPDALSPGKAGLIRQEISDMVRTSEYLDEAYENLRRYETTNYTNSDYFSKYEGEELLDKLEIRMDIGTLTDGKYEYTGAENKYCFKFVSDEGGKLTIELALDGYIRAQEFSEVKLADSIIHNRKVEIIEKENGEGGKPEYAAFFEMGYHGVCIELSGEADSDVLLETIAYMIIQAEKHEKDFDEPNQSYSETGSAENRVCFNIAK